MTAIIRHLAIANPERYVTQAEAWDFLVASFELQPSERDLYCRLLLDGPIRGRYVGVDHLQELCETQQDLLIERYLKFARKMAADAARDALGRRLAGSPAPGALIVNSCTGYLCPGLSSYLVDDLDLPHDVRTLDLMGMGCGGALPNLHLAATMAMAEPGRSVVAVAVEVCSATLFMGPDPALVVSNAIFGDGAAAAVIEADAGPPDASCPAGAGQMEVVFVDMASGVYPQYREELRYRSQNGRLRNVLTRYVPAIAARTAGDVTSRLLERQGLTAQNIDFWIVHPAGTAVLERVADKLTLPEGSLDLSHEIFRDYGNMSSPSVLFVLKRLLASGRPQSGQRGVMLAFGAGFTAYAALIEFQGFPSGAAPSR